jgi:two-component system nitrate/nitrite response regulator NarL
MRRPAPAAEPVGPPPLQRCSVLIVEPCRLLGEGLAAYLRTLDWTTAVEFAASPHEALASWEARRRDIVLLAMGTPEAAGLVRVLVEIDPMVKVVALDVEEDEAAIIGCAELGVAAMLLAGDDVADLEVVVGNVLRGRTACSPLVATALLKRVSAMAIGEGTGPGDEHLTPREREVLALIELGWTNKQIAQELCIEVRTVKNHVHNLLEKLRVSRRGEAAARLRSARVPPLGVLRTARVGPGPSVPR